MQLTFSFTPCRFPLREHGPLPHHTVSYVWFPICQSYINIDTSKPMNILSRDASVLATYSGGRRNSQTISDALPSHAPLMYATIHWRGFISSGSRKKKALCPVLSDPPARTVIYNSCSIRLHINLRVIFASAD